MEQQRTGRNPAWRASYGINPPLSMYANHYSKLPRTAVILRPLPYTGGLADQMYRYAYAYTAARDLGTYLYIALRPHDFLSSGTYSFSERPFGLHHFQLNHSVVRYIREKAFEDIPKTLSVIVDELGPWQPEKLPRNKVIIITEAFQSDRYFGRYKDELIQQFIPSDSVTKKPYLFNLVENVRQSESVSVHVRRGDFLYRETYSSFYRVLPISYQIRAMYLMLYIMHASRWTKDRPIRFFVFSDDMTYTREHMANVAADIVYVSNSSGLALSGSEELELMTMCKHNIISNSGYSWWAGWLNANPRKLVIAPFPRHRYRFYKGWEELGRHKEELYWNNTYPSEWLTLNPYVSYEDML